MDKVKQRIKLAEFEGWQFKKQTCYIGGESWVVTAPDGKQFEGYLKWVRGNWYENDGWEHFLYFNLEDALEFNAVKRDNKYKIPDYLNDLNAVRRLEGKLNNDQWREYYKELDLICYPSKFQFACIHASAEQKCEALLKVLNKGEED